MRSQAMDMHPPIASAVRQQDAPRNWARAYRATAVALGLLTLLGLTLLTSRWGYDDPYITFRYASNLLSGHGFVYNLGERTLSTTAPLYALVLAFLGWFWPNLPALGNFLSALALVLSAGFLFGIAANHGQPVAGMIAALLLPLSPTLTWSFGAETCLSVMLILAGFYAYDRSRYSVAALSLVLAVMVRPDGVLAAGALALYHLARRRPVPWRAVILYAAVGAVWFSALALYFGSPIPVTLLVKQQQGLMEISPRFWDGLLSLIWSFGERPLYWLHVGLALVGARQVAVKARHWIPLLLWTALYAIAYSVLGVSRYFWYYAPLVPGSVVLVGEGAAALLRTVGRARVPRIWPVAATGLLLLALLAPSFAGTLATGWHTDPRTALYRDVGQWLEANTPTASTIGLLEAGIVGYYARRPVIDFAGLIRPEVARQFTFTATYQDAAAWTIQAYEPDYVLLHPDDFYDVTESEWFQEAYAPVRAFASEQGPWLTVYRQREAP
jgi:hypothetical protein